MMKRRSFLKQLSTLAAASLFPTDLFWRQVRAAGEQPGRRHLINLIGYGGWDGSCFHNTFSGRPIAEHLNGFCSLSPGGFEYEQRDKLYRYTSKCSSLDERELGTHPNGVTRLGPAFSTVASAEDLQQVLIWKGLDHPGNHVLNNFMINQGNSSSYAVSFAGLTSALLARQKRLPLHYVLLSDTPTRLFTQFAMAEDAAIPICIADATQFQGLTSRDASEPANVDVIREIDSTVERLTRELMEKRAKLASSQRVASAFGASVEGSRFVYGSNLFNDPEFIYLQKYYFLEALKPFTSLSTANWLSSRASAVAWTRSTSWSYNHVLQGLSFAARHYSPLPSYEAFKSAPSSYLGSLADIAANPPQANTPAALTASNVSAAANFYLNRLRTQSWYYAFADFLVRRELSAVVDVPAWPGEMDAHGALVGSYLDETLSLQFTFGLFFALQRSLRTVPITGGGNLLDMTTIALHTEFDRYPYHESKTYEQRSLVLPIGTNHAPSASILLAGAGIQGGRVVGGVHEGPASLGAFPRGSYLEPLPIDHQSGQVSASGKKANILSIAPTVLAAFGGTLPPQQLTDFGVIPAVLKPRS
jgi:hypothetical protein